MASNWDLLVSGQYFEGVIQSYTNVVGVEMFWGMLGIFGLFSVYMVTRDSTVTSITAILLGGVMFAMLPPAEQVMMYLFITIGIAGLLYKLIKG